MTLDDARLAVEAFLAAPPAGPMEANRLLQLMQRLNALSDETMGKLALELKVARSFSRPEQARSRLRLWLDRERRQRIRKLEQCA